MPGFPIDAWLADMNGAVDRIIDRGQAIYDRHRSASLKAAQDADRWQLAERLEEERRVLGKLFDLVRDIINAIEDTSASLRDRSTTAAEMKSALETCTQTIETRLPGIENAFLTIRRAAQDLLQWCERSGKIDGSELPDQYRSSYADLIAYAPVFNPMITAFQHDVLRLSTDSEFEPLAHRLVSAVNRYNASVESARAFVRSVVRPPFELVFHDTKAFDDDLATLPADRIATLATEINDCCQQLLYDRPAFDRQVHTVGGSLGEELDSSLTAYTSDDGWSVLFTLDEDPLFHQLVVTLLHVVREEQLGSKAAAVSQQLYKHLSNDSE